MRVTIRLFAGARELAGAAAVVRDLPDGATVHDLSVALCDAYPGLREMRLRFEEIEAEAISVESKS